MSGHNIVSQLTQSLASVNGVDLKAPLLLVGSGAPNNSGAERHDAHLYLDVAATNIDAALYVNLVNGSTSGPGHSTTSNWDALDGGDS
tara:strand:- start:4667 stop:4930 length:264 start_codon:yes stop_codon:yes gene_type:complete